MKKKLGRPPLPEHKKRKPVTFMLSYELAKKILKIEEKNQWAEDVFIKTLKGE